MSKVYPPEDVEKALALAAAGASVSTIAQAVPAPESAVRGWLRKASSNPEGQRPGHPPTARPAPFTREPSADPSAAADGPTGAPAPSCRGRCGREGPTSPLTTGDVCRRLEQRLADMVDQSLDAEQSGRVEDRMLKICRIIEFLRSGDEITATLNAMHDFAKFCLRTLSETDMQPVRMAISRFLDELKRENS